MKSRSLHNSTKKGLWFFLPWRYGLSWSNTHPHCFPSRSIMKNAETLPPRMRHVIIEQAKVARMHQICMCFKQLSYSKNLVQLLVTLLVTLLIPSSHISRRCKRSWLTRRSFIFWHQQFKEIFSQENILKSLSWMFNLALNTALFYKDILVIFIFNFCDRKVEQFLVQEPLLNQSGSI